MSVISKWKTQIFVNINVLNWLILIKTYKCFQVNILKVVLSFNKKGCMYNSKHCYKQQSIYWITALKDQRTPIFNNDSIEIFYIRDYRYTLKKNPWHSTIYFQDTIATQSIMWKVSYHKQQSSPPHARVFVYLLGLCLSFTYIVFTGYHLTGQSGFCSIFITGQTSRNSIEVLLCSGQSFSIFMTCFLKAVQSICYLLNFFFLCS